MPLERFGKGVINLGIEADKIPLGAASDSLGWRTRDTSIELIRGKILFGGEETAVDKVKGYHIGYKNDGTAVHFRKINTTIQYYNTTTELWVNTVTGLTASAFYSFGDYTTVAGTFVFATGVDGCFKIHTANPESATTLNDTTKSPTGTSDYGKNIISESRMFAFDLEANRAGLYLSHIDEANNTTVSSEAIGSSGLTNYTGTLAFKAGDSDRTSYAVVFTDGTQTLTDDRNGGFTGDGSGTINYTTGAYNITFDSTTTGSVTADYLWENSNNGGITDFTFSATRIAGEGDFFPQEVGGARIQNVWAFDNKYYTIKDRSAYELDLTADDTNATNKVFNANIGSLNHNSSAPTSRGIMLMDTSNPNKPQLVRLSFNQTGDKLVPTELAPNFDFSKYNWSECVMTTYGEDIVFTGREGGGTVNNRVFRYNSRLKSVDIHEYNVQTMAEDAGVLYVGDSLTRSTYKLFDGFDDDEFTINNFWNGADNRFKTDKLKRFREIELKGFIAIDQSIEVYAIYDGGGENLIGTIKGTADYVDKRQSRAIGSIEIGQDEIGGGGEGQTSFFYYTSLKVNTPKFGRYKIRFKATGIGFCSISFIDEKRVQLSAHGNKIPHKYRTADNI